MPTKKAATKKASASTKATATGVIARKSITVGVARKSSLTDLTKALERQLKQAGCGRCLSGLDRLIIDSRINVG